MAFSALKVAIRCALAVAVLSTAALGVKESRGECIEGLAGESKNHKRELKVSSSRP